MTVEEILKELERTWAADETLPAKVKAVIENKLKAAEELAKFIDDRLGNHALVINQGDQPNQLRALLQAYERAGK